MLYRQFYTKAIAWPFWKGLQLLELRDSGLDYVGEALYFPVRIPSGAESIANLPGRKLR